MALQTSGAISFSQIAAHFGGAGSHSLSEYRALAGLGVSGIPASGAISFSTFYGKSNQVTTSVWVSSGYNGTVWSSMGTRYSKGGGSSHVWSDSSSYNLFRWSGSQVYPWGGSGVGTTLIYGGYKYVRGSYKGNNYYAITKYSGSTQWIDTSAYQNQTTTVQIST